jgi:cation diffusion facilitator CzcD-associated flavoprotein CzcO
VDVSESPVEAITRQGVKVGGKEYEADAIVFATGFDAMTGALLKIDIRGKGGLALRDKWREGPRTYLGLGIAGFPNLFTVTGPGSSGSMAFCRDVSIQPLSTFAAVFTTPCRTTPGKATPNAP